MNLRDAKNNPAADLNFALRDSKLSESPKGERLLELLSTKGHIDAISAMGSGAKKYLRSIHKVLDVEGERQEGLALLLADGVARYIGRADAASSKSYLTLISQKWSGKELVMSPDFLDLLGSLGGRTQEFIEYINDYKIAARKTLPTLLDLWRENHKEMIEKKENIIDLFLIAYRLDAAGYKREGELAKIIKSTTNEELRILADNLESISKDPNGYKEAIRYITKLDEGVGLGIKERMRAIESLSVFTLVTSEMKMEKLLPMERKLEQIAISKPRSFNARLNLIETGAMYSYLKSEHPDLHAYLVRHLRPPSSSWASTIDEDGALLLINTYRRIKEAYPINSRLNIGSVSKEKHQLARRGEVKYSREYEQAFLNELYGSVSRALGEARALEAREKYERFLEFVDLKRFFLSNVARSSAVHPISKEMENVIQGYFTLSFSKRKLKRFLKEYIERGSVQASLLIKNNPANARAIAKMEQRGTNLPRLYSLSADYVLKAKNNSPRLKGRIIEIYAELLKTLPALGKEGFAIDAALGYPEGCLQIEKRLSLLPPEHDPRLLELRSTIRSRLNDIKSVHAQLRPLEGADKVHFYVSSDYIDSLQLGVGFGSCLNITSGLRNDNALARAFDSNNFTLFARKGGRQGQVLSRVSIIETDKGMLLNSAFYENTSLNLYSKDVGWIDFLQKFASASNRDLIVPQKLLWGNSEAREQLANLGAQLIKEKTIAKADLAMFGGEVYFDLESKIGKGKVAFALKSHYLIKNKASPIESSEIGSLIRDRNMVSLA